MSNLVKIIIFVFCSQIFFSTAMFGQNKELLEIDSCLCYMDTITKGKVFYRDGVIPKYNLGKIELFKEIRSKYQPTNQNDFSEKYLFEILISEKGKVISVRNANNYNQYNYTNKESINHLKEILLSLKENWIPVSCGKETVNFRFYFPIIL